MRKQRFASPTFRSSGAELNFSVHAIYKHCVPPGLAIIACHESIFSIQSVIIAVEVFAKGFGKYATKCGSNIARRSPG